MHCQPSKRRGWPTERTSSKFTKSLWGILERCLTPQPDDRPNIEGVLQCLGMVSTLPEPPSPGVGEEMAGIHKTHSSKQIGVRRSSWRTSYAMISSINPPHPPSQVVGINVRGFKKPTVRVPLVLARKSRARRDGESVGGCLAVSDVTHAT